jgi:hypothetical protein
MRLPKIFKRNYQDDREGTQTQDAIYFSNKFRVIVSFDEYYSSYGAEHFENSLITEVLEGDDRIIVKYLFTLPFSIPYTVNHGTKIVRWIKPDVFKVVKRPKKIKVPVEVIENVIKYCESQAVSDKLGKYGDFYYKLKRLLKHV